MGLVTRTAGTLRTECANADAWGLESSIELVTKLPVFFTPELRFSWFFLPEPSLEAFFLSSLRASGEKTGSFASSDSPFTKFTIDLFEHRGSVLRLDFVYMPTPLDSWIWRQFWTSICLESNSPIRPTTFTASSQQTRKSENTCKPVLLP